MKFNLQSRVASGEIADYNSVVRQTVEEAVHSRIGGEKNV